MSNKIFYEFMNRIHDIILAKQWIHYTDIDNVRLICEKNNFDLIATTRKVMIWYDYELLVFRKK